MKPQLEPERYLSQQAHQKDVRILQRYAWHLIGTTNALSQAGDYVATTILGIPVFVRNCDGQLVGFRNVCAHRHCQLFDEGVGRSEAFKCRYHGWQYGGDGRTRRLPKANQFPGFDREAYRLETFEVGTCGQLVFIKLLAEAPTLAAWLDEFQTDLSSKTTGDSWFENLAMTREHQANWKIPIEGSLESYHLDEVHAGTFGKDPGEEATEHRFTSNGSVFQTSARGDSAAERLEAWSIRWLTGNFHGVYTHLHVYPNLMASLTETITLVYQVQPVAPNRCQMNVYGFGRTPKVGSGPLKKLWARGMGRVSARIATKILDEDAEVFPRVQDGKNGAVGNGIFARSEERLFSFHQYLTDIATKLD